MVHSCYSLAAGALAQTADPEVLEVASIVVEEVADTGLDVLRMVADPSFDRQEAAVEGIRIAVEGHLGEDSSLTFFCGRNMCSLKKVKTLCHNRSNF